MRALRFKPLIKLSNREKSAVPTGLAMWVLKFDEKQTTLSQAITSLVKRKIEGMAVYGI
jgi:hypothetical protein